jgi:hypothetical protein
MLSPHVNRQVDGLRTAADLLDHRFGAGTSGHLLANAMETLADQVANLGVLNSPGGPVELEVGPLAAMCGALAERLAAEWNIKLDGRTGAFGDDHMRSWPSDRDREDVEKLARSVIATSERLRRSELTPEMRQVARKAKLRSEEVLSVLQGDLALHTQQILQGAREASGVASKSTLAAQFAAYARAEWWAAEFFRILVIVVVAAAALLAYLQAKGGSLDTTGEIAKLAWTLPLAGLATYLARESSHHRGTARWARILTVQLQTITAYCDSLGADQAASSRLRAEFGMRAFLTEAPNGDHEPNPAPSAEIVALLQQLVDATRVASPAGVLAPNGAKADV